MEQQQTNNSGISARTFLILFIIAVIMQITMEKCEGSSYPSPTSVIDNPSRQ